MNKIYFPLKTFIYLTLFTLLISSCASRMEKLPPVSNAECLHQCNVALEKAIIHDIFSPPVASRIYTYPNLAAYEILQQLDQDYQSLHGFLNDFPIIPLPGKDEKINHYVAACAAFCEVGKSLVYSDEMLDGFFENLVDRISGNDSRHQQTLEASIAYGRTVADEIIAWAATDGYKETRSQTGHTVSGIEGQWKPTPLDYMDGLEPHWNKIRPFCLKSANQFIPERPTPYNTDTGSQFYKEMLDVYHAVEIDPVTNLEIAKFWDCNPFVMIHKGHTTYSEKKLTPGGHWMNICRIVSKQTNLSALQASEVYAKVAVAINDGFISCWDEKYRSNYIRPVTAVHELHDPKWFPPLTTPNFPEYPSGHSVISASAAIVLTDLFGENISFIDSTETPYGIPPRSFGSFIEASEEAAISRFYGGIHFMPAITNGIKQGKAVGSWVNGQWNTRDAVLHTTK